MGYLFEITPADLVIETHYDDVFTKVIVRDGDFSATGVAERMLEDEYSFKVGYTIAYARAVQRLYKKVERALSSHPQDFA